MNTTLIPSTALSYADAEEIYGEMMNLVDERDEDVIDVLDNLYRKAVRYAGIRAGWDFKSRQEKMDTDDERTSAHDSFITAVKMMGRIQRSASDSWMSKLDFSDRKIIGDYACYIAMSLAVWAR